MYLTLHIYIYMCDYMYVYIYIYIDLMNFKWDGHDNCELNVQN